ncbi:MAG: hypothetical protein E7617_07055 [Ruminococcaceae bacterium]|nr:hypothetical protein [Oscillospiraceae bacterium]
MDFKVLRCPKCGAEDKLSKKVENGTEIWDCVYCNGKFYVDGIEHEYERLESTIRASLGSVITEALLRERIDKYYNLRSMLWEKITASYIDSKAIVSICHEIKQIDPHDFLAEFFELANSGDEDDIAEYINDIDVKENILFLDVVIEFLIKSIKEEYITPISALLDRVGGAITPEDRNRYLTRFEAEVKKINDGIYDLNTSRDIFLAYSSKDMKKVIEILNLLELNGFTCFAAFRNLQHGRDSIANYEKALHTAIDNCGIFLLISSENSRSATCDAYKREIPYVISSDMQKCPECRIYSQLPKKYRKLRLEYRLDNKENMRTSATIKEFFDGVTYAETTDQLLMNLCEYSKILDSQFVDEDAVLLAEETRRREAAERKLYELETEKKLKEKEEALTALITVQQKIYENGDVYEGQMKYDRPHGKGKMILACGEIYEGDYYDGKRTGKGKYIYANGALYEGDFVDGKFHGKGKYTYPDGSVYDGEFLEGKMHGSAVITAIDGTQKKCVYDKDNIVYSHEIDNRSKAPIEKVVNEYGDVYEGQLRDGLKHGWGKFTLSDGEIYEGNYADDKPHGRGKMFWKDGNIYEGDFVHGIATGKGRINFADGDYYEGDIVDSAMEGKGRLVGADGTLYEGDFVAGAFHGKGKYTYENGDVYEGDFCDGDIHGRGKFSGPNGVYEGEWKYSTMQGKGKFTWVNGDVYEGDYVDAERHGKGKFTWADGDVYEGDWNKNKRTGKGKYTWADGDVYEGDFIDGIRHGKGKMINSNGTSYEGGFKNDLLHGKIIFTYSTGEKERQTYRNGMLISVKKKWF